MRRDTPAQGTSHPQHSQVAELVNVKTGKRKFQDMFMNGVNINLLVFHVQVRILS